MGQFWIKAGAIGLATGVLGLLMLQAGLASGCGSSQPQPEPPITTKASKPPASEPPASEPSATAAAEETEAVPNAPPPSPKKPAPRYMPATKSGGIFHAPNAAPEPPPQSQSQP